MSLAREAWIEIAFAASETSAHQMSLAREAWIEILLEWITLAPVEDGACA